MDCFDVAQEIPMLQLQKCQQKFPAKKKKTPAYAKYVSNLHENPKLKSSPLKKFWKVMFSADPLNCGVFAYNITQHGCNLLQRRFRMGLGGG